MTYTVSRRNRNRLIWNIRDRMTDKQDEFMQINKER